MISKDEALKMAIDGLEIHQQDILDACKEALAEQPTQEPYAWVMVNRNPDHQDIYFLPTKPTREQKISHQPYELYTHPKQWQGDKK